MVMANNQDASRLQGLESKDADFLELVELAAEILGINLSLDQIATTSSTISRHTFKEEWVLRWFMHRLGPKKANGAAVKSTTDRMLDARPWVLLLHLVRTISSQKVTELFVERRFMSTLNDSVKQYLDLSNQESAFTARTKDISGDTSNGRPSKRRRLSPESPETATSSRADAILMQVCASIAEVGSASDEALHDSSTPLWSSGEACATFMACSLSLAQRVLNNESRSTPAADSIPAIMSAWDSWLSGTGSTSKPASGKIFNSLCLEAVLKVLELLRSVEQDDPSSFKRAKRSIEAQLSKTTILPLRARLQKTCLRQWRSQGGCLTWEHVSPIVTEFRDYFKVSARGTEHLFDIAMRLIPKYDLRVKQQEQFWVDMLLLGLSYYACPRLSQLTLGEKGGITIVDAVENHELVDDQATLTALLGAAAAAPCNPSAEVVSYLAAALGSWPDFKKPWAAHASFIEMRADSYVPSTQLPTSEFAFNHLIARVEESSVGQEDLTLLRDNIVIPLLRSFSASRALQHFIEIWRKQLQEAMRAGRTNEHAQMPAVRVWQDDKIFEELKMQVALSTSTITTEQMLKDLHSSIPELSSTKAGSLLHVFATIALGTTLLEVIRRPIWREQVQLMAEVLQSISLALARKTDFQGQRYRLWQLVNTIQKTSTGTQLPESLLDNSDQQVSLANAEQQSQNVVWNQECLAKFTVLMQQSLSDNAAYRNAFKQELENLQGLITQLLRENSKSAESLWDGRSLTISSAQQLASACLAKLLEIADTLDYHQDFAEALLATAMAHDGNGADSSDVASPPLLMLVQVAARAFADKSETALSKQLTSLATKGNLDSSEGDLSTLVKPGRLARGRLRPAYLRATAEVVFKRLQTTDRKATSLGDLAECIAFVTWVSTHVTAPYTKVERWSDWKQISDSVGKAKIGGQSHQVLVLSRLFRDVAGDLLQKATESAAENGDALALIVEDITKTLKPNKTSRSKPQLSAHLLELHAAAWICSTGKPGGKTTADHVAEVQLLLAPAIVKDLSIITSGNSTQASISRALVILEVAAELPQWSELRHAAIQLKNEAVTLENDDSDDRVLGRLRELVRNKRNQITYQLELSDGKEIRDHFASIQSNSNFDTRPLSSSDYAQMAAQAALFVSQIQPQDYAQCLELCPTSADAPANVIDQFVIGATLRQIREANVQGDERLFSAINAIAALPNHPCKFYTTALLKLENAKLALTLHPRTVTQATIDCLLSHLAIYESKSVFTGPTLNPHLLTDRICTILGTLLSRFRRRLSDRHHLLLPVLQSLLRTFFYSPAVARATRSTASTAIGSNPAPLLRSLPLYLKTSHTALPPSSATHLSRLLSSICNPTVSAAKSSASRKSRSNNLNDETKRVKVLAAQHMQYLIMEYCRCTLDGEIDIRVKEKLLPGMYAVLDGMGREVMKGMNENMDMSSRAIFRGLFEGWNREGRWSGS